MLKDNQMAQPAMILKENSGFLSNTAE